MKKLISISLLIILIAFFTSCTKEKRIPTVRAVPIILANLYMTEPNPIYEAEAKEVNELFRFVLTNRDKLSASDSEKMYSKAMALYESRDETDLEDSVDFARVKMMQALSISAAAILSKPDLALKYFETAKKALIELGKTYGLDEDRYSALLVLEIVYLYDHKLLKETKKEDAIKMIKGFQQLTDKSKQAFIGAVKAF